LAEMKFTEKELTTYRLREFEVLILRFCALFCLQERRVLHGDDERHTLFQSERHIPAVFCQF